MFGAIRRLVILALPRVIFDHANVLRKGITQAKQQTGDSITSGGIMVFNKRGKPFLT